MSDSGSSATPQSARQLFEAAIELPQSERRDFVQQQCGSDTALAGRVLRLLEVHEQQALPTWHLTEIPRQREHPEQIGDFEILGVIGEGGMGVVYEAEQPGPVRRRVAIKLIRGRLARGSSALDRFLAERQALALLDHPSIAKIHEGGETPDGQPYFVMELVRGLPLHRHCDENRLRIEDRIKLVVRLCQAIQHAHQKGIVHRDLKPSNVLVVDAEGEPVPKVIDFGIAKVLDGQGLDWSVDTMAGETLGTPAYMSPEQAGISDVDTRADVYSLGIVLYELLTGLVPVDPRHLGHHEFLARLARGEIQALPPSERILVLQSREIAAHRSTNPKDLAQSLHGDLDAIVLKAIDPDRERRYGSVVEFGEDLERFLRNEPVRAQPPTLGYRLTKFLRRHRFESAAALIALLAISGGGIAAGIGMIRARQAETAQIIEAASANETANFLVDLFRVSDPSESRGQTITAAELLDRGVLTAETGLRGQPQVQSRMFETLSRANLALGAYAKAVELAQKSLARAEPGTRTEAAARLQLGQALLSLGKLPASKENLEIALRLRQQLDGPTHTETGLVLQALGGLHWRMADYPTAERLDREAIDIAVLNNRLIDQARAWRSLGIVLGERKRYEESIQALNTSMDLFTKEYGAGHISLADVADSLAIVHANAGRFAPARQLHERAFSIRKQVLGLDHPVLAFSYLNLARIAADEKRTADAARYFESGIALRDRVLSPDHPQIADILESYAIFLAGQNRLAESARLFARSLSIYQKAYGPRHPETLESHRNSAILDVMIGHHPQAIQHLQQALDGGYGEEMHLEESVFDPLRKYPAFRKMQTPDSR